MKEYRVESAESTSELVEKVNRAMNEGYKLVGGISACLVSERVFFFSSTCIYL